MSGSGGGASVAELYVEYLDTLAKNWSSGRAAGLLSPCLISYIEPRFHRCSSPLKVRVLLSFLYLDEYVRRAAKEQLMKLLAEAEVDNDEWVRKLSRLISSFVVTGSIDIRDTDSEAAFGILKNLPNKVSPKPPLEAPDLCNVITEYLFVNPAAFFHDDDDDHDSLWWTTQIPQGTFATTNFTPGIDLLQYATDISRKGDILMRRILDA